MGPPVGLVGAYYTAPALDDYAFFGPGHFRRQSDLELDGRADIQRGVRADVHSGGAQVSGDSAVLAALFRLVNLDRQFQGKAFPRPRIGHKTSSLLPISTCETQLQAGSHEWSQNDVLARLYHGW